MAVGHSGSVDTNIIVAETYSLTRAWLLEGSVRSRQVADVRSDLF